MPYFTRPFSISEEDFRKIAEEEYRMFTNASVLALGEGVYGMRNFGRRYGHILDTDISNNNSNNIEI